MAVPSINFINPFREVSSAERLKLRGLAFRSSFLDKLSATFNIFSGNERFNGFGFQNPFLSTHPLLDETPNSHLGLWDFVTFGVPWAIGSLFCFVATISPPLSLSELHNLSSLSSPPENFLSSPFAALGKAIKKFLLSFVGAILGLLNTALELTRLVAALTFTIAASPFVLIIHGVSQAIRAYKMRRIEALGVTDENTNTLMPLGNWVKQHNCTIDDVINNAQIENDSSNTKKIIFLSQGKFSVAFFKPDKTIKEGLEDLADLSPKFNKQFQAAVKTK